MCGVNAAKRRWCSLALLRANIKVPCCRAACLCTCSYFFLLAQKWAGQCREPCCISNRAVNRKYAASAALDWFLQSDSLVHRLAMMVIALYCILTTQTIYEYTLKRRRGEMLWHHGLKQTTFSFFISEIQRLPQMTHGHVIVWKWASPHISFSCAVRHTKICMLDVDEE